MTEFSKINQIQVEIPGRAYPIFIGKNLLKEKSLLQPYLSHQVMIVTNQTLAPLYLDVLLNTLSEYQCDYIILPDGEQYKNLTTLNQLFDALLTKQHDMTTTLCALGGGVVGDITGFAAASYRRGVSYIQLPTSLLAQVDSAIGGKTGVNHPLGKNMIGAIYQPRCVVCDVTTLTTLPQREFRAGLAEVIKYGLIVDAHFFTWLESNLAKVMQRNSAVLMEMISTAAQIKASIVAADEKEKGERALLNFGHTFGHAIESATQYQQYLHGEAVALGMILAADLSMRLNWLEKTDFTRIKNILEQIGLPTKISQDLDSEAILRFMAFDKKIINKKKRLILLKKLGQAMISDNFMHEKLQETLKTMRE